MADEPQKAAPVAETEKAAPEVDQKAKNGTSPKTDKPEHAADSKEADAAPRVSKSERSHKDKDWGKNKLPSMPRDISPDPMSSPQT
jgi:hypothetical protein